MHLAYNVQRQKQTEYNSIKQIHCHCIHNVVNGLAGNAVKRYHALLVASLLLLSTHALISFGKCL